MRNKFAERSLELRKKKKISQRKLAKELGISPSTVGLYELKKRLPDAETIFKYAQYFCCSADYLLGLTHNPKDIIEDSTDLLPPEVDFTLKNVKDFLKNKYKKKNL